MPDVIARHALLSDTGVQGVPISVVILARNEEQNIRRCVESLRFSDDVWVVDDHSTDDTRGLAEHAGARVASHAFSSFAGQRNWALDSLDLEHDWVLLLDADEAATEVFGQALSRELTLATDRTVAFRTCRKTMLGGRWLKHADGFPVWIMRIVRRGRARFADSGHGEVPVPDVNGEIGTIREPFLHYPFSRGLSDWLTRHVRYAGREAELELSDAVAVHWRNFLGGSASDRRRALRNLGRRLPMRPTLRFFYQYVLRGGFLDGREGFIFCQLMAEYERMIVMKRWELRHLDL